MLYVIFNGKKYVAKLFLRESLFNELKRVNPNLEVELICNETGQRLRARICDLTLSSQVRHL